MTCEKAIDRYLSLDKGEWVPPRVTLHLICCPVCRTLVRKMAEAERFVARPLAVHPAPTTPVTDPVLAAALARIAASGLSYPEVHPRDRHVSLTRWLVSGLALAFGFAAVPSSFIGEWSSSTFGASYTVPFYLLCGLAVTGYCGMFIGTNIDFFVKKLGLHSSAETLIPE